jgi:hypothetical protein
MKACLVMVAVTVIIALTERHDGPIAAAQGTASSVERAPAQARVPAVDEYYPVKTDWVGPDRSIRTIKHGPTGSCYILVYPSGDTLMPVEKERCAAAPVEK